MRHVTISPATMRNGSVISCFSFVDLFFIRWESSFSVVESCARHSPSSNLTLPPPMKGETIDIDDPMYTCRLLLPHLCSLLPSNPAQLGNIHVFISSILMFSFASTCAPDNNKEYALTSMRRYSITVDISSFPPTHWHIFLNRGMR
jgi:hypothetical protein